MNVFRMFAAMLIVACCHHSSACSTLAADLSLTLRYQQPVANHGPQYHTLTRPANWKAEQTALIVCDVWDTHNCKNAAMRVVEMAPRLNRLVEFARKQGVTIIHAPSNCMDFYADHQARQRAILAPQASNYPAEITQWCYSIPAEERGIYPIDQSNGGCDDAPEEHAAWQASLAPRLKDKKWPWRRQIDVIRIDPARDYITDKGDEVWNILEAHGIENVIMTGVHTNMCVLGRPFGLRRLVTSGKNTVLVRDMTDTMYDPRSEPFVSHFTGTDLIVGHIERHVCPTITSDQLIDGTEFRFSQDDRKHIAILIAEDEYRTHETLPEFAVNPLGQEFRTTLIYGSHEERNLIPGLSAIQDADALVISVRRRTLPPDDLQLIRNFVADGKPIIGIRTASHAFCLRNKPAPNGLAQWPEFDAEVFGGNYTNHYGNQLSSTVVSTGVAHPILKGIPDEPFQQGGSLYKTAPLDSRATVLLTGSVEGQEAEPVAWTFIREDGGKSFYTSLGHVDDFKTPAVRQLLSNAIRWAVADDE